MNDHPSTLPRIRRYLESLALALIFAALVLSACRGESPPDGAGDLPQTAESPAQEPDLAGETPAPVEKPTAVRSPEPTLEQAGLPTYQGELFAASGGCAACHRGIVTQDGAPVSSSYLWPPSTMANASRDPYWLASVRREVEVLPADHSLEIQAKCAVCHLPMAHTHQEAAGEPTQIFDEGQEPGLLNPEHPLYPLAIDGVSCTLCHQMEAEGFGAPESFSGEFVVGTELPAGERPAYGPYQTPPELAGIMQGASGFIPRQGEQVSESGLCGACHTLFTPTYNDEGEIVGEFPEQMAYPEWLASAYAEEGETYRSCNDCHMPVLEESVPLSITGGPPRSPYSEHLFAGGNAFMRRMLETFADELDVAATADQFDRTTRRAVDQIREKTAALALPEVTVEGGRLTARVEIDNLAGHKFPSGFPSRRAWLHFAVLDGEGRAVFESGAYGPDGFIAGNANDEDPARYEAHYERITRPDQVQIYEPILGTVKGEVTTDLLKAAGYLKDNRILPLGFEKEGAPEEIAVYGEALADGDFAAPRDTIEYAVDLGQAAGPYTVRVELLYQTIGYRWAYSFAPFDFVEAERFMAYYQEIPNIPLLVAQAEAEVK